jgi:hypothetical protein
VHDVADGVDMAILAERMRHIEASVRRTLGDVEQARAILEELEASAAERGFVPLAELYRRDLEALAPRGRD